MTLCIGFLLLNCSALLAMSVQHVAGVEMPDVEYSLVVGKQDSLLHFYQQEANSDSVWVNTFTCDTQGNFSNQAIVYSYLFEPSVINEPIVLLFEYRYEKLYLLAQVDSTSVIACVIEENGNSVCRLIDTDNVNFAYLFNPTSNQVILFNESTIMAATARAGSVYSIDLATSEMQMVLSYPNSTYRLFPLIDDYVIVADLLHDYVPNYFIDRDMILHEITGYMPYGYTDVTKVGEYYLAKGVSPNQSCAYSLLYVQNNLLVENILSSGIEIISEVESIVPLDNCSFIGIFKIHYIGGQALFSAFAAYDIINGETLANGSFPQLTSLPDPRNLIRINENCIVALSGVFGEPIQFTTFDPETQQYHTDTYQIDTDAYAWEWEAYQAGNNFYLIKGNKLHSFRVDAGSEVNDPSVPQITDLSCYPNPFTDVLNIDIKLATPSKITVNIYDIKGRKISSTSLAESRSQTNVVRLTNSEIKSLGMSSGVYYVQVISGEGEKVLKTVFLK